MKKKFIIFLTLVVAFSFNANAQYFEATIKKSGINLEFYIRPKPGGTDITNFKFDNIDMYLRWPTSEPTPVTGTPVVNTVDFPGLTILDKGDNQYGTEAGFINREWASPAINSTTTARNYVAGVEYLVFSVPVTGTISSLIEFAGNNEDVSTPAPYYLTLTRTLSGVPGATTSDHSSHNPVLGGNITNQLFYAASGLQLTSSAGPAGTSNFFQKISAILPVKFTSFDATKKENNAILNWAVNNEDINTNRYEIERSIDGKAFEKIQTLLPLNNGTASNVYTITDINVNTIKNVGLIIYYRIKQVDNDGKFEYSVIKNIRLATKGNEITAFPNPIKESTTIQLDLISAEVITMTLISAEGKTIQTFSMQGNKGINTKKIDMSDLSSGNYMLKVITETETKSIKLVKL
jgi:Secretion system C-terminal sorting domain